VTSPGVWVPILTGILTVLTAVITVYLTGRANLRLEHEKFQASSELESQKFKSDVILQVIATGDHKDAQRNLHFLIDAGLLPDPSGRIKAAADQLTPVLPAPGGRSTPRLRISRWPVRTGSDPDAANIDDTPVPATVEKLIAEPRPEGMRDLTNEHPEYQNRRAEGVEMTVYRVEAVVVGCKLQINGSYHLILRGTSGKTMLANCPDPHTVDPESRWAKQIAAVRAQVEKKVQPRAALQKFEARTRIVGVGYFNRAHGQVAAAPNGIELTPVLQLEWLD